MGRDREPRPQNPKNLIFWGAGATAGLGVSMTATQARFLWELVGKREDRLEVRVCKALACKPEQRWRDALFDLLTILGDSEENDRDIDHFQDDQLAAMRRNLPGQPDCDQLRRRILQLRMDYDWPALKAVVRLSPGFESEKFQINDVFNLLDLHIAPGFGFRAPPMEADGDRKFLTVQRLIGARGALMVTLISLFYIEYRTCIACRPAILADYRDFAGELGRRARSDALAAFARGSGLDTPGFFRAQTGFVSLNFDPIGLWTQFVAHRELNQTSPPHVGSPATPLHVFHDFGHMIPARRIDGPDAEWPWYPLNEGSAERLNEEKHPSGYRVVLTKFLFPHGCLCWRHCPDCGKLSAYHGDTWQLISPSLFPPPPLMAFDDLPIPDNVQGIERERRLDGAVDARACLHCGTLTYARDTQIRMQSSFKTRPPSFVEEVERDLGTAAMTALHFIFMGYSLPPDDVEYRAFFAARRRRSGDSPRCTVVSFDAQNREWRDPLELEKPGLDPVVQRTVIAARDIFGKDNVRFFGGGVPAVFLGPGGRVTADAVQRLLRWESGP
ncbi:MAG: hypothetical protein ACRD1L_01455 [Terriglobales bacterium]